jgi:hypothetical protein
LILTFDAACGLKAIYLRYQRYDGYNSAPADRPYAARLR